MSGYTQVNATIEVYIGIEDLGITDFDNLTDKQVWILFRAYDSLCEGISANPLDYEYEMNFDLFDPNDLYEKYGDRYNELCVERDKEFAEYDEWVKEKDEEIKREASIKFHKIADKWQ